MFRDRAKEDDIKRRYKKSMTCSIRIKCEGRSAIFELVLRADLMTCCRTENNNAPLTSTSYWFARDVTDAKLVAKKKKHFSPLGSRLHFHINSLKKLLLFWPPTLSPCHAVANQELVNWPPWWKKLYYDCDYDGDGRWWWWWFMYCAMNTKWFVNEITSSYCGSQRYLCWVLQTLSLH